MPAIINPDMNANDDLPWTPDFEHYSTEIAIRQVEVAKRSISLVWSDGRSNQFDIFLLRENSPDEETIHPLSREMKISPLSIPEDLQVVEADIDPSGALRILWSTGETSRYHPGWLRTHAWFDDGDNNQAQSVTDCRQWNASMLSEPPSFDGASVMESDSMMLEWLEALSRFGIARLRGLPDEDGLLERIVEQIGPIRESNFGRRYVLEIKSDPDSNAFTSDALLQHVDMPTRESPHGLQFLYCRTNTTTGGEGVYVDGFHIAELIRKEVPEDFEALTQIPWLYKNRARQSDYRAQAPAIKLDRDGNLLEIRVTPWLRAPMVAPLSIQQKAYRSIRTFTRYAQDPANQLVFKYEAGDLLAFDNRRVLHGRRAYSADSGQRTIEGIYADRDELYSKIRILRRAVSP